MRFRLFGFALLAAPVALGACLNTDVGPTGPTVSTTVDGRVLKQDGTAVKGGAQVFFALTSKPVNGTAQLLATLQVTAGEDGRFTGAFIVGGDPGEGEVSLRVTPPLASGLLQVDTLAIPVTLGSAFPSRDTTYVEVTLPPR